ncbi:precorrin-6y C5,15-methyltransferase (decarboxylating) subunit CbiE, partial [Hominenteromicrobium sp.]|uniref:precorrin-6y C5,15-methyltransferase (decarboxylating) subunit CbiE n=1 Tax=Hominenteromicrobium sp. TaxID=3073581 RepID=UPI003A8F93FC
MKITLVGMGSGTFDSVTMQGAEVLHEATLIIGAKRLLENLPDFCMQNRIAMYKIGEVLSVLGTTKEQNIALVYSGDTGFYSGASALCRVLDERQIGYTVIPGVSSVQLLSAAIHEPWQNWNLVSAHGCACDPVAACSMGKPTFFLTGGEVTPAVICAKLTEAGLGDVQAVVGENLGTPQQKISKNAVRKISESVFAPLCVLLVESCEVPMRRVPGLPDEVFIRGKT